MTTLEIFLYSQAEIHGRLSIVGGSPLFTEKLPYAISINGFHKECSIAAINSNRSDLKRCIDNFEYIIAPNPTHKMIESVVVPESKFQVPDGFPGRQPTTYFSLILTCDRLTIPTDVYGICGRASKYHYGDWEMWYMKHKTKWVTIHDPRPKW